MTITLKLAGMAKPQEFTIYPVSPGDKTFTIQSDKRIAQISMESGWGVLSKQQQNGAYFPHLSRFCGAYDISLTPDQLTELKLLAIAGGRTIVIAGGVATADNSGIGGIKL